VRHYNFNIGRWSKLIKGVFFDLYGTLINAEHLFFDIAMEISIETNYDVERVEKIIKQKYNKGSLEFLVGNEC